MKSIPRRGVLGAVAAMALLALAACGSTRDFGGFDRGNVGGPSALPSGEVLGSGSIRIALLVPLSANGNAGQLATNMRNASELAVQIGRAHV